VYACNGAGIGGCKDFCVVVALVDFYVCILEIFVVSLCEFLTKERI
jgi:hypothetical protein